MSDLISNLQRLGDAEHDDLSVAHDALAEIVRLRILTVEQHDEIERLTAERDELRRQLAEANRRFDWLAERLEDVQIDNADPNDNYLDGEEDVPYTVLWRRAIDAAMGLTLPAEES